MPIFPSSSDDLSGQITWSRGASRKAWMTGIILPLPFVGIAYGCALKCGVVENASPFWLVSSLVVSAACASWALFGWRDRLTLDPETGQWERTRSWYSFWRRETEGVLDREHALVLTSEPNLGRSNGFSPRVYKLWLNLHGGKGRYPLDSEGRCPADTFSLLRTGLGEVCEWTYGGTRFLIGLFSHEHRALRKTATWAHAHDLAVTAYLTRYRRWTAGRLLVTPLVRRRAAVATSAAAELPPLPTDSRIRVVRDGDACRIDLPRDWLFPSGPLIPLGLGLGLGVAVYYGRHALGMSGGHLAIDVVIAMVIVSLVFLLPPRMSITFTHDAVSMGKARFFPREPRRRIPHSEVLHVAYVRNDGELAFIGRNTSFRVSGRSFQAGEAKWLARVSRKLVVSASGRARLAASTGRKRPRKTTSRKRRARDAR